MTRVMVAVACLTVCMIVAASPAANAPVSGIDTQYNDHSVRPQDDFYRYVNGKWLDANPIPADKERVTPSSQVGDNVRLQLRALIQAAAAQPVSSDPDAVKIANLYASFMDKAALNTLGLRPLAKELASIDGLRNASDIPGLMGKLAQLGVAAPLGIWVLPDARDATRETLYVHQGDLGLPDRNYYLQADAGLIKTRKAYLRHIQKMLSLAGDTAADLHAKDIVSLETRLATAQWSDLQARDPVKTYNRVSIAQLSAMAPSIDWATYFAAAGLTGTVDSAVVLEPGFVTAFDEILKTTPLTQWKVYFRWQLLRAYAPYLGDSYADEAFAFDSTELRGIQAPPARWVDALALVDDGMGEGLGKMYVAKYFPPETRARAKILVQNIVEAYRQDIDQLDWMTPQTKIKAKEKLASLSIKIGYPDVWRDYSNLTISRSDLVGNVMRFRRFGYLHDVGRLGSPVDRNTWQLTPQTIDAYEDPSLNEVAFPAGLWQPPFFNPDADDAANYGAIGGSIGHEISHGFDDEGSQYDAHGTLLGKPGWFTSQDQQRFTARTKALVAQYSAREPLPGYHVDGEVTLGENIADNSGLAIAYKAYQLSLRGHPAPMIDGLTGDQRFFMSWTQKWRANVRDSETIRLLKSDVHSPRSIRGIVPVLNEDAFYTAFDVKPGDKMYLAPEQRVTIW